MFSPEKKKQKKPSAPRLAAAKCVEIILPETETQRREWKVSDIVAEEPQASQAPGGTWWNHVEPQWSTQGCWDPSDASSTDLAWLRVT